MIDATPSLEAAGGITGRATADYLADRGWRAQSTRIDGVVVLSKIIPEAEQPVEIVLPVQSGFSDETRRVADALRTLSQLAGTSVFQVADDIRRSGAIKEKGEARQPLSGFHED